MHRERNSTRKRRRPHLYVNLPVGRHGRFPPPPPPRMRGGSPITGLNRSDHTVRGEGEGKRRINIAELVALSSSGDYSKLAIIGVKGRVTNDRPFFASEKNVPSRVVVSGYDNKIGGNGR